MDLDQLLESVQTPFKSKKGKPQYVRDGLIYLVDLILDRYAWRKEYKKKIKGGFVPLHSQKMRDILTNYHLYINYLIANNVIERNDSYEVGKHAKGYRLTNTYKTETIEVIISTPEIVEAILLQKAQAKNEVVEAYPELVSWFDGLEIDAQAATGFIDQWFQIQIARTKRTPKKKRLENLIKARNSHLRSVHKIKYKDYRFIVDTSGYRLHTVLTNMKKELRQFLTYKRQPLICTDLSSSQPFLSLLLLKETFYQHLDKPNTAAEEVTLYDLPEKIKESIRPAIAEVLSLIRSERFAPPILNNQIDSLYKGFKSVQFRAVPLTRKPIIEYGRVFATYYMDNRVDESDGLTVEIECDWMWYTIQILKGEFYNYVGEEIQKRYPNAKFKIIPKKMSLAIFFANDNESRPYFKKSRARFIELFPTIYELFRTIKSKQHATLANLLQSLESELFLNRIAKRISKNRPDIPLFTVHDSIATTQPYQKYVEQIMREEIEKATGKLAHFKKEEWSTKATIYD